MELQDWYWASARPFAHTRDLEKFSAKNFFFQKFGLAECEDFKTECEDRFFMGNWLAGQPIVKFD